MPRQLRIEFPGACYHVMARGDRREDIYLDDIDRNSFLSILGEASKKTSWRIHAYVLMDNHYHLLIKTPKANLVKGMTWLQSTYTIRFNARHKLRGHVFGGRYKAILVDRENDNYFSTLLDYIHLNPVRAGIIKQGMPLEDFSWSSISYYILPPSKRADWQHASDGLASLDCKDSAAGRRKFLKDLQTRVAWEEAEKAGTTAPPGQSLQSTLRRGWFFGSQSFKETIEDRLASTVNSADYRRENGYSSSDITASDELKARALIIAGLETYKLSSGDLASLKKSDPRKCLIAFLVKKHTSLPLDHISASLCMGSRSGVSRATVSIGRTIDGDRRLRGQANEIEKRALEKRRSKKRGKR